MFALVRTSNEGRRQDGISLLPEYLNSRTYTIFGGAAEVQLGIIASSVVGL